MKNPITVVFFGKSGAGKGTQAELLLKDLAYTDKSRRTIFVETGQRFRDFFKTSPSYMAGRIKDVLAAGKFLPPFLPIWTWTQALVDEIKTGDEHIVFDGVCRQPEEGAIMDGALQFLGRATPFIILLETDSEEATKRLIKRGRYDDKPEKILSRFKDYETGAVPSINHFRKSPHVNFVTIDGNQSIEKVHEDIVKVLGIQCAPSV